VFVQSDHNLAVTSSLELVASLGNQFVPNLLVIIKLSVDYGMHSIFCVVEWLCAVRAQVVDGQSVVAEGCRALLVHSS